MAVFSGPEIPNNGLVFYYDMFNTQKSWKGAPTTNLLSNPLNLATGRTADASCGSSFTDFTTGGPEGGPYVRVTRVSATGIAADWPFQFNYSSIPIGTNFKFSCYARCTNGSVSTIEFSNPDVQEVSNTLTTQWQRFSTIFTSGTQSNLQFMRINRSNANDKTVGSFYDVANAQIEVQTVDTPFVNGTRSATQSILDLTNNSVVTVSSLNYNSNNTFSFTGTNSLSIPSIDFSQAQTIEIWLQPLENDATRRNPYNQAYGGYGTWTHEPSGNINYYYGDAGSNAPPYIGHTSGFTVVQNEIAHVVTTRNTTTSWWYKNGVQGGSYSHGFGTLTTDTNAIIIGTGYAGGYIGNIFSVKLYNRALSAAEIQQNFEATRGRFGI